MAYLLNLRLHSSENQLQSYFLFYFLLPSWGSTEILGFKWHLEYGDQRLVFSASWLQLSCSLSMLWRFIRRLMGLFSQCLSEASNQAVAPCFQPIHPFTPAPHLIATRSSTGVGHRPWSRWEARHLFKSRLGEPKVLPFNSGNFQLSILRPPSVPHQIINLHFLMKTVSWILPEGVKSSTKEVLSTFHESGSDGWLCVSTWLVHSIQIVS